MFVFVYSSYHLNFSFSHLVVILTTLEAPKNIFCFNNNIMNDNSKQDHPTELSGRATRGTATNLQIVLNTQKTKNPYLN